MGNHRRISKRITVWALCLLTFLVCEAQASDNGSAHGTPHSDSLADHHVKTTETPEKSEWSLEVQDINLESALTVRKKNGLNLLKGSILVTPRFPGQPIRTAYGDIELEHAYAEIVRVENGVEIYVFSGSAHLKSLNQKNFFSIDSGTMVTMKTTSRDGAFLLGLPQPINVKEKMKSLVRLSRNPKELYDLSGRCAAGAQKISAALAEAEKKFFNGVRDEMAAETARQEKIKREIASERQKLRKLYEQKTHQTE